MHLSPTVLQDIHILMFSSLVLAPFDPLTTAGNNCGSRGAIFFWLVLRMKSLRANFQSLKLVQIWAPHTWPQVPGFTLMPKGQWWFIISLGDQLLFTLDGFFFCRRLIYQIHGAIWLYSCINLLFNLTDCFPKVWNFSKKALISLYFKPLREYLRQELDS